MADIILLSNPMTTANDLIVGGASGAAGRLAKGSDGQVLTVDPTTHNLVWATPASGFSNPMTTKGDTIVGDTGGSPIRKAVGTDGQVLTADAASTGGIKWATPSGGSSLTTVEQEIAADYTVSNDSTFHDVTGLTGISVAAGTWLAFVNVEIATGSSIGVAVRLTDGTTTYMQANHTLLSPPTTLSNHLYFSSKPLVLGSTTTMKLQIYSDTGCTIKKYPIRGGDSGAIATHITFLKIA